MRLKKSLWKVRGNCASIKPMKILGVVFALVLLFLPLSMHLEATNDSSGEFSTSTIVAESETKGVLSLFIKRIRMKMEKADTEDLKTEYIETKSKFEGFQKKVEGLLKKLNNTES